MNTRESLVETSREAAGVAWQNAEASGYSEDVGTSLTSLAKTISAGLNGVRCAILATIAEPAPPEISAAPAPPLSAWAYVELMGHRVLVGYVEEDKLAGRLMLRIRRLQIADRKPGVGEPEPPLELEDRWRIYSPASVYSFEAISEAEARSRYLSMSGGAVRDSHDDIPF